VYVSKELPAMEALGKVPTRQPSEFETGAIEKLRGGEDLVIESRADTVKMVGSIRARQQCLGCHQTERGALLGAFSYDLAREPAKAEK
jgi:hypothetical protein